MKIIVDKNISKFEELVSLLDDLKGINLIIVEPYIESASAQSLSLGSSEEVVIANVSGS